MFLLLFFIYNLLNFTASSKQCVDDSVLRIRACWCTLRIRVTRHTSLWLCKFRFYLLFRKRGSPLRRWSCLWRGFGESSFQRVLTCFCWNIDCSFLLLSVDHLGSLRCCFLASCFCGIVFLLPGILHLWWCIFCRLARLLWWCISPGKLQYQ